MKFQWIMLIVLVIGLSGCEKSKTENKVFPDGTYIGTFQRTINAGDEQISNVVLTFYDGKWSGQTDILYYPALCHGLFTIENNKIEFTNECAWPANFDWSLILSGEFDYTYNDSSLVIQKSYTNSENIVTKDIYTLTLPKSGIKKSPMEGTWIESEQKTDTIIFSPEYDGQFPVFNLNREFRVTDSGTLPGYSSGPYWYILGTNSISLDWFLSSYSWFNRYYFDLQPGGKEFKILNFFAEPNETRDTLTFVKTEND
jgi:hypothetical protein